MTNELKRMLFEYLAAAYPCGIICEVPFNKKEQKLQGIIGTDLNDIRLIFEKDDDLVCECYLSEVLPYLRPMTSMTEEDLISYANYDFANNDTYKIVDYRCPPGKGFINLYCSSIRYPEDRPVIFQRTRTSPLENWRGIDWLNAHHFDYRGLIGRGLALKAPEGMYND